MLKPAIQRSLNRARSRLLMVGGIASVLWGLLVGIGVYLLAMWLDLLWELPPEARIAATVAAGALSLVLVIVLFSKSLIVGDALLTRRLDEVGGTGGIITSGWDLERATPSARAVTQELAAVAVKQACQAALEVPVGRVAPATPMQHAAGSLATLLCTVALVAVIVPGTARTQWNRFLSPWDDVPPFTALEFLVEPGDANVVYGQALDIFVATKGPQVDDLELVYKELNGKEPVGDKAATEEQLPMFQQQDGRWRTTLARVTEPSQYIIRSGKARSKQYGISVVTVPNIGSVRLRVSPPAYTREATYEGPVPKDGIAGLPGTSVVVLVRSNRPLKEGRISLTSGDSTTHVALQTQSGNDKEVHGSFTIEATGKFEIIVTDVQGQQSLAPFSGSIVLLEDQRPLVRLLEPRLMSLATPTSQLPVAVAAEDDYGVAHVQLYRSINHTRSSPLEMPVSSPSPRRYHERPYLPLAAYGLEPGDEIKLFARVEDNDPAGAKATESQVVTIRIIAQEEFERMVRMREGLQVLMSKYQQAERRLEAIAGKIEALQKELEESPADMPLAQQKRDEIKKLVEEMHKEAAEIAASAKHVLPYDVDRSLTKHLEKLADALDEAADALAEAQQQEGAITLEATEALTKLAQRLGLDRQEYRKQTTEPLAHLEKVFPLMEDQARFIQLAAAQRDLADRLEALKDEQHAKDPAVKVRMRQLEEEQRGLREQLDKLVRDIESHLIQLPSDPEFDKLRQTALAFVAGLQDSGPTEAMTEAEEALGQFSGARASCGR